MSLLFMSPEGCLYIEYRKVCLYRLPCETGHQFPDIVCTNSLEWPLHDHCGLDCSLTRGRKAWVQNLRGWSRSGFSPVLPVTCLAIGLPDHRLCRSTTAGVQTGSCPTLNISSFGFRSDCGLFSPDFHAAVGPDCSAVTNPDL